MSPTFFATNKADKQDQQDGYRREQEAEAGLHGQGRSDVALVAQFADCSAELRRIRDHCETPYQAQRG